MQLSSTGNAKPLTQRHQLCATNSYVLLRCQSINCPSVSSYKISTKL